MQALADARAHLCADLSFARRTVKSTKPRIPLMSLRFLLRSTTSLPSLAARFHRRLRLSLKAASTRLGPLRATNAVSVTETVDSSATEVRELGWARTFQERFDLEDDVLGEGSFGVVKTAIKKKNDDDEKKKKYAVKIMKKDTMGEWDRFAAMVEREVTHWQKLQSCQQVVHLEGVYEDDDNLYIVQELCHGGDVQHFLMEKGTLTEDEAAQVVTPVLKMLAACHDKNICFGDVKPANFMLKKPYPCKRHLADPSAPKGDIIVKGIDFGCSQKLSDNGKLKKRTGTPLYMAPEIFFGWYSVEVDIWAVGMMLYQMIAGKLPFFGDQAEQLNRGPTFMIVQAVMESELDFNGAAWDGISSKCKDLIRALLDVDYNTRLTAKSALHHPWIKRHSREQVHVREAFGNIIKFPGSSGPTLLQSGGNGHDGHDGREN